MSALIFYFFIFAVKKTFVKDYFKVPKIGLYAVLLIVLSRQGKYP